MKRDDICGRCRFCLPIGKNIGECHFFPPRSDGKGKNTIDEFPTVKLDYIGCGMIKKGAIK